MNDEIKEILELTIQFVEEELDKGIPKKDIIKTYSTHVGEAFNHIKHYITNLQQAVKNTKETADDMLYELNEENEKLKSRIEKANEIIDLIKPELWNISNKMTYRLIDIKNALNGRSDK